MVDQNLPTVELWWEKMEVKLRRANTEPPVHFRRANTETYYKKSRLQETLNLSIDADSSTDTTVGWTKNAQKNKKK